MIQNYSRRLLLTNSLTAGLTVAGIGALFGAPALAAIKAKGSEKNIAGDIAILNAALDLEHQGIWAYSVAAPKLSDNAVGQTVLALAKRNLADHVMHRDVLKSAVQKLGGTPAPAQKSYDLSPYTQVGEGNLDSDANIAKLALALEVDAALAYNDAFAKLRDKGLISAAATIGPNEAAHATAIRAVFRTLDSSIQFVPSAFISAETRHQWVLKV